MADLRSSPMLPLRWSESPSGRAHPNVEPTADMGTSADRCVDGGADSCIEHRADEQQGPAVAYARPEVVVRTSSRRRRTAGAFWENGRIVVVIPTHVPRVDRPQLVEWLVARVVAKRPGVTATDDALTTRACALADRYVDGVRPASIRWVTNQEKRWGSCSTHTREIRLSHRLRSVPDWVLDATIVHELAHLVHPDHSAAFHAVANRFPRQRDALLFLDGYSLGLQTRPGGAT